MASSRETSAPTRRERGALKGQILDALLHAETPLTAKQIRATFSEQSPPELATVLTVLERLRRAGDVERTRGANGELEFTAAREDSAAAAHGMLDRLLASDDRTGALMSFAGSLSDADLDALRSALAGRRPRRGR